MSLERIKQIRDVFSYSKRFKNKVFVVYLEDSLLQSTLLSSLAGDLQQLLDAQVKVIVVPDIQHRAEQLFSQFGRSVAFLHDSRVGIVKEDIELLESAVFETVGKLLSVFANRNQLAVVGNWVYARSAGVVQNRDMMYSGKLAKININAVHSLLNEGIIPIIPSLGWSQKSIPYYLPAMELASQLSAMLGASKLIFLRDIRHEDLLSGLGLEKDDSTLDYSEDGNAARLTVESALEVLHRQQNRLPNQLTPLLQSSLYALERGVDRVHVLDCNIDGVLLIEVFFDQGIGFMIHADEYRAIGPVMEEEVDSVYELMLPHIKRGTLVYRDQESVRKSIKDYVAYRVDGEIYGVASLHVLDATSVEIAGLAVHERYDSFGVGKRLMHYLLHKAQVGNFRKVYCLTQTIGDWFELLGFTQVEASSLPKQRYVQYQAMARNSRVYLYTISDYAQE